MGKNATATPEAPASVVVKISAGQYASLCAEHKVLTGKADGAAGELAEAIRAGGSRPKSTWTKLKLTLGAAKLLRADAEAKMRELEDAPDRTAGQGQALRGIRIFLQKLDDAIVELGGDE